MIKKPDLNTLKAGDLFWISVEQLHPTQFCVGILSAECKRRNIEAHAAKGELRKFLCQEGRLVPVVIGPPGKTLYLADHHHLCVALWRAQLSKDEVKEVAANVIHDWSDMPIQDFWAKMVDQHLAWLYDQNGTGPLNPSLLPSNIGGVLNDPYRTLSRWVRDAGCYVKDELKDKDRLMCDEETFTPSVKNAAYFIEFRWANFLRRNIDLDEPAEVFHLTADLMPIHPDPQVAKEVKTLQDALPQVIRLIGCNQLAEVTYDSGGCLESAEPLPPRTAEPVKPKKKKKAS